MIDEANQELLNRIQTHCSDRVSLDNKESVISSLLRTCDWYAAALKEQDSKIHNYNLSNSRFYKIEIYSYDDEDHIVSAVFYVSTVDRNYSKIISEKIKELNIDFHVSFNGEVWPKIRAIELKFEQLKGEK